MDIRHVIIYGGSFDPPHICHVMTTTWLLSTGKCDQVWWLPSYRHAFGKSLTSFQTRMTMIREAITLFQDHMVEVCPIEKELGDGATPIAINAPIANNTTTTAPVYTVNVLDELIRRFPQIRFSMVTGTDIIKDLPAWREPDRLLQMLESLIVVGRTGNSTAQCSLSPKLQAYNSKVHFSRLWLPPVSSTEIRRLVSQGENIDDLVPTGVRRVITSQNLYSNAGSGDDAITPRGTNGPAA